MDRSNAAAEAVTTSTPREARQRWRVTFARRTGSPQLQPREQLAAWEVGLAASGLPLVGLDLPLPRPRVTFGAPLRMGMSAERELLDLFLVGRVAAADVRAALANALPEGHVLVDLHDVWLGEPPLAGQVAAADYRVTVRGDSGGLLDRTLLSAACERLLAAPSLERSRDKGGRAVAYDLRPLVASVRLIGEPESPRSTVLRIRTRFDAVRGVGRPDEVVSAIADIAGQSLEVTSVVREALLLACQPRP